MKHCLICNKLFGKDKWGRQNKLCSRSCSAKYVSTLPRSIIKKGAIKICEYCHKEYYVRKCRIPNTRFCSKSCLAKVHLHKFKKYGFQKTGLPPHTYKYTKVNGKTIRLHRHIMQVHLGRDLTPSEHVHHINGDSHDNRIENLVVLSNSAHQKIEVQNRTWKK